MIVVKSSTNLLTNSYKRRCYSRIITFCDTVTINNQAIRASAGQLFAGGAIRTICNLSTSTDKHRGNNTVEAVHTESRMNEHNAVNGITSSVEKLQITFPQIYGTINIQQEIKRKNCLKIVKLLENEKMFFDKRKDLDTKFLNKSCLEIRKALCHGHVTPLEAYAHFFYRTVEIDAQTNAVFDYVPDSFEEMMRYHKGEVPKEEKPLFALPISVKDTIDMAGFTNSYGLLCRTNNVSERDCYLVEALRSLGAIIFVRTSLPEACSNYLCDNKVSGRTQHPRYFNSAVKNQKQRTPGGSSGGEATLVALGGSAFGIGSDGVGSIRIPCGFSGLYGMRLSTRRISHASPNSSKPIGVFCAPDSYTVGPMTRDAKTHTYICKLLFAHPHLLKNDPFSPPIPYQMDLHDKRKLNVGYFTTYKGLNDPGYLKRSVDLGISKLEAKGYHCVDISNIAPDLYNLFFTLFFQLTCVDGGANIFSLLNDSGGPANFNQEFYTYLRSPNIIRSVILQYLKKTDVVKYKKCENLGKVLSYLEYDQFNSSHLSKFKAEINDLFINNDLDMIVFPLWETAAELYEQKIRTSGLFTNTLSLTNFPIGCCPITKVTEEDVRNVENFYSKMKSQPNAVLNEIDEDIMKTMDCDAVGLPLALQIMTRPNRDELAIRAMEIMGEEEH